MYLLVFLSVAESVSSFSLLLFQMFHSKPANSNNNELVYLKEQKRYFFSLHSSMKECFLLRQKGFKGMDKTTKHID